MRLLLRIAILSIAIYYAYSDILPTIRKVQSVAVKGKLLCSGKPYEKARLKLYEVDPVIDTLMSEQLSDESGEFNMQGNDTEWTTIDVKLNIYHNCEDEAIECWRKIQINVPDDFITEGAIPNKTFDAGILNLNAKYPGESRDCIN